MRMACSVPGTSSFHIPRPRSDTDATPAPVIRTFGLNLSGWACESSVKSALLPSVFSLAFWLLQMGSRFSGTHEPTQQVAHNANDDQCADSIKEPHVIVGKPLHAGILSSGL